MVKSEKEEKEEMVRVIVISDGGEDVHLVLNNDIHDIHETWPIRVSKSKLIEIGILDDQI